MEKKDVKQKTFLISWNVYSPSSKPKVHIRELDDVNRFEVKLGKDRRIAIITANSKSQVLDLVEAATNELYVM